MPNVIQAAAPRSKLGGGTFGGDEMKGLKRAIDEAFSAGMEFMAQLHLNREWAKAKKREIMRDYIKRNRKVKSWQR